MKKANGPKNKKKLITHLLTMPQAAGKNIKNYLNASKIKRKAPGITVMKNSSFGNIFPTL